MKIKVLLAILFFGTFICVTAFLYVKGRNALEKANFSGIIERISYDEKSIANVTVNGISYHLTPLRKEFKEKVRVGDSIEKKNGISVYKITKQKDGEIINFEF